MGFLDFLEPNAAEMTPKEILVSADEIIAQAKQAGHPQTIFNAMIQRVASYGVWQEDRPEWVCPDVAVVAPDDSLRPEYATLSYGTFTYECRLKHTRAPEYETGADGYERVSISCSGELIFAAGAPTYGDQDASTWGDLDISVYVDGDALRNLVAAARVIEEYHQQQLLRVQEANERHRAPEARKTFGI
jgi:hypothetical protein